MEGITLNRLSCKTRLMAASLLEVCGSTILTWKTTPKDPFPTTLTHWYWILISSSDLPSNTFSSMIRLGSRSATRALSDDIQLLSLITNATTEHQGGEAKREGRETERNNGKWERQSVTVGPSLLWMWLLLCGGWIRVTWCVVGRGVVWAGRTS